MGIDNQVLLGAVLVVGIGYIILRGQPQLLPEVLRNSIDAQNLDLQLDECVEIFHDFRREHKQKGTNGKNAPLTDEEAKTITGLQNNIGRLEHSIRNRNPFTREEQQAFRTKKHTLLKNLEKYQKEYEDTQRQNEIDKKTTDMDLGDIVAPGQHQDLFNSAAGVARARVGSRGVILLDEGAARSLSRSVHSLSRLAQDANTRNSASLSHGSQHSNINTQHFARTGYSSGESSGGRGFRLVDPSSKRFQPISEEAGTKRGSATVAADEPLSDDAPFQVVKPKTQLLNTDDAPRSQMVGSDDKSGFEAAPPDKTTNAKRVQNDAKEENAKRGGTKGAKETPAFVGPMPDTMPPNEQQNKAEPFKSAEGLDDDNELDTPEAAAESERPKKRARSQSVQHRGRSVSTSPAAPDVLAVPDMDSAKVKVQKLEDNPDYIKLTSQVQAYFETLGTQVDKDQIRRTYANASACLGQLDMLGAGAAAATLQTELERLRTEAKERTKRKRLKRRADAVVTQHAVIGEIRAKKPKIQAVQRTVTPIKRPEDPAPLQQPRQPTGLRKPVSRKFDSAPGGSN